MSDDEVTDQDAQLDDVDSGEDESDPVAPELAQADEQDEGSTGKPPDEDAEGEP